MWTINTNNPLNEFKKFQQEITDLFNYKGNETSFPLIDVYGNEEELVLYAEIPGVDRENIELLIENSTIKINGKKNEVELNENDFFHRSERKVGEFSRSLKLPYDINNDAISAEFKDGVLSVRLPRAEQNKPRKITIQ